MHAAKQVQINKVMLPWGILIQKMKKQLNNKKNKLLSKKPISQNKSQVTIIIQLKLLQEKKIIANLTKMFLIHL